MRKLLVVGLLAVGGGVLAVAQTPAPALGPEYQQLGYLVGVWKAGGQTKATPISAAGKFAATITCSKFAGGRNVVCNVEGKMGAEPYHEMAIFGYDPEAKLYTWYDIDSTGMNSFTHGSFEATTWIYTFDLKADGKPLKLRVRIKQLGPKRLENYADLSVDGGEWLPMQAFLMQKIK